MTEELKPDTIWIDWYDQEEYCCPKCGGEITCEFECPGWRDGSGRVMVCYPTCDNSTAVKCTVCDWKYLAGNRGLKQRFPVDAEPPKRKES